MYEAASIEDWDDDIAARSVRLSAKRVERVEDIGADEASMPAELERREQPPTGVVLDGGSAHLQKVRELLGGHQLVAHVSEEVELSAVIDRHAPMSDAGRELAVKLQEGRGPRLARGGRPLKVEVRSQAHKPRLQAPLPSPSPRPKANS